MKKRSVFITVVAMLLCLLMACTKPADPVAEGVIDRSERKSEKAAQPTDAPTAEPTQEPTAEPTQAPTSKPTAVPTQEPTPEPTAKTLDPLGYMEGENYINGYFGLSFTLPEGWEYMSDGAYAANNAAVKDSMSDIYAQQLEDGTIVPLFMVLTNYGLRNINVQVSNIGLEALLFSQEELMDMVLQGADLKTELEKQGYKVESVEKVPYTVAGKNTYVLLLNGSIEGYSANMACIIITEGTYMMNITLTCIGENVLDAMTACFSPLF